MIKPLIMSLFLFSKMSLAQDQQRIYMGALGDSLTAGLNADAPFDQRDKSWSDGSAIESHAVRLEKKFGVPVSTKNVSVSGSRIEHLAKQTEKLLSDNYKPDYVTLLIGANDICDGNLKTDELSNLGSLALRQSLDALIAANSNVKILIGAVPNINYLYSLLYQDQECQENWRSLNICERLLLSTKFEREKGVVRWAAYNEMQRIVSALYTKNVKFVADIRGEIFELKDISRVDCFHPSTEGQRKIAEVTWQEGWFN